jgi:hypothetical protein
MVAITTPAASPTVVPSSAPVLVSGTAGDDVGVTALGYALTGATTATGSLPIGATWSFSTPALQPGTTTLTVTAHDAAGHQTAALVEITVSLPIPAITSATAASATVGSAFTYQITATGSPNTYAANPLPAGLAIDTHAGTISGTPTPGAAGDFVITLAASNAANTGFGSLALHVAPAPPAPTITSPTSATATVGTPFTYTITASAAPTAFGAGPLPAGLGLDPATGIISGTPTVTGTSTITLSATNAVGSGTAVLTLVTTALPPAITSSATAAGTEGAAFTYAITATNGPTVYGAAPLPGGLALNAGSGIISGNPTAAGTSVVIITATNTAGTGIGSVVITVSGGGADGSAGGTASTTTTPGAGGSCGIGAGLAALFGLMLWLRRRRSVRA